MAKKEQTYGESIKELKEIMELLENEDLDVDVLMKNVKRASELIKSCKSKLTSVNEEIQKVLDDIE